MLLKGANGAFLPRKRRQELPRRAANKEAMMRCVPQRLADLRYYFTDRPVPLAPLQILAQRDVSWHEWNVTLFVLGTSHAVRLERNGIELTELLTCAVLPHSLPALAAADATEPASFDTQTHGMRCRMSLEPFPLEEGDRLQTPREGDSQMHIAYPAASGQAVPLTRIGWLAESGLFCVETVHTYPDEALGVRSRTCFSCEEAG